MGPEGMMPRRDHNARHARPRALEGVTRAVTAAVTSVSSAVSSAMSFEPSFGKPTLQPAGRPASAAQPSSPPGSWSDEEWTAARARLLALAADLDDLGVRARLSHRFREPVKLRCWNPDRAGETVVVTCKQRSGRWLFCLPDGEVLADAQAITQPGQAVQPAQRLAAILGVNLGEQA